MDEQTGAVIDGPPADRLAATPTVVMEQLERNMRAVARGDERALRAIYDATASRVFKLCYGLLRDRPLAEEAVSDTYFQVWRTASKFDAVRGNVMAYLIMIARTRALDLGRRRARLSSAELPLLEHEATDERDPEHYASVHQQARQVHRLISALPPAQAEVISLSFLRGLSHTEIAAGVGLPLGTVKTYIRRALLAMREQLAGA
jgi:RNA polymerase sigma-70 factor (ECF subfamily)